MTNEDNELGVSVRFRRAVDRMDAAHGFPPERYDVRGPFWLIPFEDITLEEFRRRWPASTCTVERMDFTRASELTPEVSDAIDDAFEYHAWTPEMVDKGALVRLALSNAVKVIVSAVPPGPDRTTAIRKIREARMDSNSAITHGGKY